MISWGKRNRGLLFFQARQGRAPHPERKWCTTFIAILLKRVRDQLLLSDASILFTALAIAFWEVATFFMSHALPPVMDNRSLAAETVVLATVSVAVCCVLAVISS